MWGYIALSFIAFVVCLFTLHQQTKRTASPNSFSALLTALASMNLIQSLGFLIYPSSPVSAEYMADSYLIISYFLFTSLVLYSYELKGQAPSKRFYALYAFPIALSLLHIFGFMVDGYRIEQDSLMHYDGPLAILFDVYALTICIATLLIFVKNIITNKKNNLIASKNILSIIALIPFSISLSIIIFLSRTKYAIPVVVIMPISTIYMVLAFNYIQRKNVINLFIKPRNLLHKLSICAHVLETREKHTLNDMMDNIEREYIKMTLNEHNYNIDATAQQLGVHKTTVYNRIKKYELQEEALKNSKPLPQEKKALQ